MTNVHDTECREITHFGRWGHPNSRCHRRRTHAVVATETGIVHYTGCEKHARRMMSRFAGGVELREVPMREGRSDG